MSALPGSPFQHISKYSVYDEHAYRTRYVWLACLNACLGAMFLCHQKADTNFSGKYIILHVLNLDDYKYYIFYINALLSLGGMIGAFTAGSLAAMVGRVKAMIICDAISIVGVVLTLIAQYEVMLLGRFICGVGCGLNLVLIPLYVNEISPVQIKAYTGLIFAILASFGTQGAFLLGFFVPSSFQDPPNEFNKQSWRIIYAFPVLYAIFRPIFLIFVFKTDTPIYLIMHGSEEEAHASLSKLYVTEAYVQEQFVWLQQEKEINQQKGHSDISYSDLFSHKLRKRFFIGIALSISSVTGGVNAATYFSSLTFQSGTQKLSELESYVLTNLVAAMGIVGGALALPVSRRFGYRLVYLAGGWTTMVFMVAMIFFGWIESPMKKVFFLAYILAHGISLGACPPHLQSEVLPARGYGIAAGLKWIGVFLFSFFPYLQDALDGYWSYSLFIVLTVPILLGLSFTMVDTQGLTQAEIAERYMSGGVVPEERIPDEGLHSMIGLNTPLTGQSQISPVIRTVN